MEGKIVINKRLITFLCDFEVLGCGSGHNDESAKSSILIISYIVYLFLGILLQYMVV